MLTWTVTILAVGLGAVCYFLTRKKGENFSQLFLAGFISSWLITKIPNLTAYVKRKLQ